MFKFCSATRSGLKWC